MNKISCSVMFFCWLALVGEGFAQTPSCTPTTLKQGKAITLSSLSTDSMVFDSEDGKEKIVDTFFTGRYVADKKKKVHLFCIETNVTGQATWPIVDLGCVDGIIDPDKPLHASKTDPSGVIHGLPNLPDRFVGNQGVKLRVHVTGSVEDGTIKMGP